MLLPSELMHTDKVLQMLPYFMIGRYLLGDVIATIKRLPGFGMTCMFAYMLIIGFSGNVYDNAMGFYWNHVSLSELMLNSSSVVYWIARMGTAVLGIVALLYFFDLLLKFGVVSKLSVFGRTTLGVYILHQDILAVVINPILSPNAMLVLTISNYKSLIYIIISCVFIVLNNYCKISTWVICHFIIMASKKVNFINAFLWELPKRLLKEN